MKHQIQKRISTLRNLILDFLFTVRLGNPKRDLKLTVLMNSGLARARIISKKDRCSREQFCKYGFPNSPQPYIRSAGSEKASSFLTESQ